MSSRSSSLCAGLSLGIVTAFAVGGCIEVNSSSADPMSSSSRVGVMQSAGSNGMGGAGGMEISSSSASWMGRLGSSSSSGAGGSACPQDCAGADTPCATRSCVNGMCGMILVAAGMDALTQTPGDCQKDQCDGQGNVVPVPDPTDIPVSGNTCVVGSCVGGVPTLTPVTGVACKQNGGKVCDNGTCVQCLSAANCPAGNDCNTPICAAGKCQMIQGGCFNPPPCYLTNGICLDDGCHYYTNKAPGVPCPGGLCFNGQCVSCSLICPPPPPCHVFPSTCDVQPCVYPNAPAGTPCAGGTCDGNGACL